MDATLCVEQMGKSEAKDCAELLVQKGKLSDALELMYVVGFKDGLNDTKEVIDEALKNL